MRVWTLFSRPTLQIIVVQYIFLNLCLISSIAYVVLFFEKAFCNDIKENAQLQ